MFTLVFLGTTMIYTFGSEVKYRRHGTHLEDSDNDSSATNLTEALQVINSKVKSSTADNIRVFIITDGEHNSSEILPDEEISKMQSPVGKTVEVYLLGVGQGFPVEYSINIRSHLHSGSASCPSLFWSRMESSEAGEIEDECIKIKEEIKKGLVKVHLAIAGNIIPHETDGKMEAASGEFIFYDDEPTTVLTNNVVSYDDVEIAISPDVITASADFLVNNLFKQWNSVLIQKHRNKKKVPMEVFDLMKELFDIQLNILKGEITPDDSIRSRIRKKNVKTLQLSFDTQMNQSRNMISTESKFKNEIEMADAILKTTVQSKYDTKLLNIRGYSDTQWNDDIKKFKNKYVSLRESIISLPVPSDDESCHVLFTSFLSDLQDPNVMDLFELGKIDFLNTINFTGIPVLAPVRDFSQINAWTLHIKRILVSPLEIISQRALESSYNYGIGIDATSADKEVELQAGNPDTAANAVIPIIPAQYSDVLKKLVRTNVFSVGATFCILKNALIVDHSCHIAALGCLWLKTIENNDFKHRPSFISKRIAAIVGTAKLYLDRLNIKSYTDQLINKPQLALMSETDLEKDGVSIKCESLVKVAFLTFMVTDRLAPCDSETSQASDIVQAALTEFLGRCLSNNSSLTPYMDYLLPHSTEITRNAFVDQMSQVCCIGEIKQSRYFVFDRAGEIITTVRLFRF